MKNPMSRSASWLEIFSQVRANHGNRVQVATKHSSRFGKGDPAGAHARFDAESTREIMMAKTARVFLASVALGALCLTTAADAARGGGHFDGGGHFGSGGHFG